MSHVCVPDHALLQQLGLYGGGKSLLPLKQPKLVLKHPDGTVTVMTESFSDLAVKAFLSANGPLPPRDPTPTPPLRCFV